MSDLPEAVVRLLPILRCVETRQPLRAASSDEIARFNERIASGGLPTHGGEPRTIPLVAALVREDGHLAYPVDEGIPCLLLEYALPLD